MQGEPEVERVAHACADTGQVGFRFDPNTYIYRYTDMYRWIDIDIDR